MAIPSGATPYVPHVTSVLAGRFRGETLRHTFRAHGTRDWLVIYTTGGSGWYHHPHGAWNSAAGDVTLYAPGAFQEYQIDPTARGWDIYFAHFLPRTDWLPWLVWPEIGPQLMHLRLGDPRLRRRISARFADALTLSRGGGPRAEAFGLNALEEVLLLCDSVNPGQRAAQGDERVRRAVDYLHAHFAEPYSEERLAHAAGLSPSRLRVLFRRDTGAAPRDYLESCRLRRARELLALSRQTIGEIAEEVGFENPFYFSLRFKKEFGKSPRDFRKETMAPKTG